MVHALDNLLVIAPGSSNDEQVEEWLAQLALAASLRPLEDNAPAFSKRPLAVNVSIVRPMLPASVAATWPGIVTAAGDMLDVLERSLNATRVPGAAVWLEASAEQILAASFAVQSFGGEQAISLMVLDVTPGAVLKLIQPLGRQALKRICAGFEGSGAAPYFLARERAVGEALLALGVPTILDMPSRARSVPRAGEVMDKTLDLGALSAAQRTKQKLLDPMCERVLELCDLRAQAPLRVTVKGTAEQIARAGAYLEDLVRSRVSLRLEPIQFSSPSMGLGALRASPILDAAFKSRFEAGEDSDPDAMDVRHIRESCLPEKWALDLSRRLADQIGHGLKDISLGNRAIQLDVRP